MKARNHARVHTEFGAKETLALVTTGLIVMVAVKGNIAGHRPKVEHMVERFPGESQQACLDRLGITKGSNQPIFEINIEV